VTGTIADLNAELEPNIAAIAVELLGEPTERSGRTWRWGRKGSLAVVVDGSKRGAWCDHEAGVGGDPVGLVAHARRCPMAQAIEWARSRSGDARPERILRPATPRPAASTVSPARRCWQEAGPATGTLVDAYLAARGLSLPADAPLRFHPRCQRGAGPDAQRLPAMLALMTDPATGEPCGVHRTFLRADGSGKADGAAKMMLGAQGVIRLVPDADVTLALGIAEGIETTLAVMQRIGWSPVWAATCAGAIASFPVLPGVQGLTIFADADRAGAAAAQSCATRWRDAGREARIIAPPTGDWDDATRRAA
jgi:hypothetical protein